MQVKISSPEILFLISGALFLSEKTIPGIVFTVLGMVGSIARVALEMQDRQERIKLDQEELKVVYRALSAVSKFLSNITVQHYGDSTDYN
jgi:hypothetical protein